MAEPPKHDRFSLSRWSQRKLEASRAKVEPGPETPAAIEPGVRTPPASPASPAAAPAASQAPELPPVESLTIESDFTAFLRPSVDEPLRRAALRKLFRDSRFNVMDGLDVYIDDYTQSTPIGENLVSKLAHARAVLDPPRTRLNAQGFVEEVSDATPAAPAVADRGAAGDGAGGERGEASAGVPDRALEGASLSPTVAPPPSTAEVASRVAANGPTAAPSTSPPRPDPDDRA